MIEFILPLELVIYIMKFLGIHGVNKLFNNKLISSDFY